jgi:Putative auto-transporter adhesin, head GIN domain
MATTSAPHRGGHTVHYGPLTLIAALVAVLILAAIGIALLVRGGGSSSSGVQGSGIAATQTRTVPGFSGLDLAGSNNVTVVVGSPQSVVVHADSNLISHVTTQVVAGTLVIGDTGNFSTRAPMSVDVSVPSLTALNLSGDGQISVSGINASRLTVTISGSGLLYATGTATGLDVTVSGDGEAQLTGLTARDVQAVVSGSGAIQVTATNSLDAAVPGSGEITYSGNPSQVTTSVTGSGAVTRG